MAGRQTIGPAARQRGSVLLLVTFSAIVILAFAAIALDTSRMFIIKSQLQNAADAGALRAAKALDGTGQGVVGPTGAQAKGIEAALTNSFLLVSDPLQSADLTVEVGPDPAGPWTLASTVNATAANNYYFARMTATKGGIPSFFGQFAGVWNAQATALAVAGRYTIDIAPVAICAPDLTKCPDVLPGGACGFDAGFGYNVAELNPIGPGTPLYVDPMGSPTCDYTSASAFGPFLCVGKSSISGLPGSTVYTNTGVSAVAYSQIDSRFGDYAPAGKCDPATAPPDTNVMQYFCVSGGTDPKACGTTAKPGRKDEIAANWMQFAAGSDFGDPATGRAYQQAVDPPPTSAKPWDQGIVWASVRPGTSPTYGRGIDTTKYPSSCNPALDPSCDAQTGGTPYGQPNGTTYSIGPGGSYTAVAHRRLMNLVIVDCPASGGTCRPAIVKAVGEFLLTRKSDKSGDKNVYVEFRRLRSVGGLQSDIRLYR